MGKEVGLNAEHVDAARSMVKAVDATAGDMGQAKARRARAVTADLPGAAAALELPRHLHELCCTGSTGRMSPTQQASRRVEGHSNPPVKKITL